MSRPLSNPFQPPTTLRHMFRTLDMCLDPSVTRFDHLQPPDTCFKPQTRVLTLQQPISTTYNHLDPSYNPPDMCFEPQTCVSTPQQPVSMPLTHSCTPGHKMHVQLYVCFFIYIYCGYIAVITSYNTYLKTG